MGGAGAPTTWTAATRHRRGSPSQRSLRRWSAGAASTTWPSVGTLRRPTNVTSRTSCWTPAGS